MSKQVTSKSLKTHRGIRTRASQNLKMISDMGAKIIIKVQKINGTNKISINTTRKLGQHHNKLPTKVLV